MDADATFHLPRRRRRAVLSLAPLIDVTFILLIFFMLVTQFERYAPVDVTLGEDRAPSAERDSQGHGIISRLIIEINADGSILYDGMAVSLEELPAIFPAKENDAVRGLLVKPQATVTLQTLIDVLTAVQQVPGFAVQIAMPSSSAAEENGE